MSVVPEERDRILIITLSAPERGNSVDRPMLGALEELLDPLRQLAHREGAGRRILKSLEARAKELSLEGIELHAQVLSKGFYEREGYQAFGPIFSEAGMPHVKMSRRLSGS